MRLKSAYDTSERIELDPLVTRILTHLERLEAEAIHIMREVVAEAQKPVMMYSVGKDSAVLLHLAKKAFYPSPPPFPLLHVDTTWKFKDMYALREKAAEDAGSITMWKRKNAASTRLITVRSIPTCGKPRA